MKSTTGPQQLLTTPTHTHTPPPNVNNNEPLSNMNELINLAEDQPCGEAFNIYRLLISS